MNPLHILIPLVFIVLGVLCLRFPKQLGIAFCRVGKLIWRIGTLGLTDMRWFYPEDKAPRMMKIAGICLILGSLLFTGLYAASFSGPGSLSAMREANDYLGRAYGSAGEIWNVAVSQDDSEAKVVTIKYVYGNNKGTLKGIWNGKTYDFSPK